MKLFRRRSRDKCIQIPAYRDFRDAQLKAAGERLWSSKRHEGEVDALLSELESVAMLRRQAM